MITQIVFTITCEATLRPWALESGGGGRGSSKVAPIKSYMREKEAEEADEDFKIEASQVSSFLWLLQLQSCYIWVASEQNHCCAFFC